MNEQYLAIFAEESAEHLQEWEAALLALEQQPQNEELLHTLFRSIHTLKGSAGFIGFQELQRLTHDIESFLEKARDGGGERMALSVDLLLRGLDLARVMVEAFTQGKTIDPQVVADIEVFLMELDGGVERCRGKNAGAGDRESPHPAAAAEPAPRQPSPLSGADGAESKRQFELSLAIETTGREGFLRAFLIRTRLDDVATILLEDPTPERLRETGEPFVYRMQVETDREEQELRAALNIDLLEIISIRRLAQSEQSNPEAAAEGASAPDAAGAVGSVKTDEVVRVSVERLDKLLNLVGELVIQNSGFASVAQELKNNYGRSRLVSNLETKTEGLTKIIRELQDGILKVRMLPINNVFCRFHRVVRDLAKIRDKEIVLEIFGQDTEIDKKVMDRIADPLVHLVRNAIDHGIETRERRAAAGKAEAGLVRLGAYQDSDRICIEVSDDGGGLDRKAILRKAVEGNLILPEEADRLNDETVLGLIFLPGFSTAGAVSEISGRGVGMDVVKKAIEGMGGSIRINSTAGRGTRVTISLPLTMAIVPALLVETADQILAVPLSSVTEVLKLEEVEKYSVGFRPAIRLREEILSVVELQEALRLCESEEGRNLEERAKVVVVEHESMRIGLGVDEVLGTGEIVVKSLSRHYREIEGLIGASILGNGRIALIADVEGLVRRYYRTDGKERSLSRQGIFSYRDASPDASGDGSSDASGDASRDASRDAEAETVATEEVVAAEAAEERGSGENEPDIPAAAPAPDQEEKNSADDEQPSIYELMTDLHNQGGGRLLEMINNTGAVQASMALSLMTGREIRVSFPETRLYPLWEFAELLGGGEQPVGGIYVALSGDISGGVLMVMPAGNLLRFNDFLYRREEGSCSSVEEVDMSGISEVGNLLSASFINAIADQTRLRIKSDVPEINVDMCQSVIDAVLSRFNQPGEQLLLSETRVFLNDSEEVTCHLLMFLEPESLDRLLSELVG